MGVAVRLRRSAKRLMVVNFAIIGDFRLLVNRETRYNEHMYALASHLVTLPVVSLQTGETMATVNGLIINPDQLRLLGFYLNSGRSPRSLLVMTSVRQLALDCVIVDNEDDLSEPDEVVRLQRHLQTPYTPMEKTVKTESGRTLGAVEDFTINLETEHVQKLYVRPPLLKAWYRSSLIIDRAQIVDIQPHFFVVRDAQDYVNLTAKAGAAKPS